MSRTASLAPPPRSKARNDTICDIDSVVPYTVSFCKLPIDSRWTQRLLARIVQTRNNCAFEDVRRLLLAAGFTERDGPGMHRTFTLGRVAIAIPLRRSVKEHYADRVIAILQQLGIPATPAEGSDGEL